jgi:hypothetical protein
MRFGVLKRFIKWLARPFFRPLMARVDARDVTVRHDMRSEMAGLARDLAAMRQHFGPLVARVQTHERLTRNHGEALTELRPQAEAIQHYLPMLLNTISSQNAAAREVRRNELEVRERIAALGEEKAALESRLADEATHLHKRIDDFAALADRIGEVERRGEFIRREILFESRYGGREKGMSSVAEPEILSPDKLAEAGSDIRLNLGCGHIPIDKYLNVDGRPLDGVDIVAEVGDLPFEPGTVAEIYSAHLLEHFPVEELRRRLLPYWFELLRPGGVFTAVVPDAEAMLDEYGAGRFSFEDLRLVTFGEQEYDGDFHFNMFGRNSLCELLERPGFAEVGIVEASRRNGVCYEMEITARRPSSDG